MSAKKTLKVEWQGDVRRLTVYLPDSECLGSDEVAKEAFASVVETISKGYGEHADGLLGGDPPSELVLKYKDSDGDNCTLAASTMEDWIAEAGDGTLKLTATAVPKRTALAGPAPSELAEEDAPPGLSKRRASQDSGRGGFKSAKDGMFSRPRGLGPKGLLMCVRGLRDAKVLNADVVASMVLQFLPILAQRTHRKQEKLNRVGPKLWEQERLRDLLRCLCNHMDKVAAAAALKPELEAYVRGDDKDHFGDVIAGLLRAFVNTAERKEMAIVLHEVSAEMLGAIPDLFPDMFGASVGDKSRRSGAAALHKDTACSRCTVCPVLGVCFENIGKEGGDAQYLCGECYISHCVENPEQGPYQCHFGSMDKFCDASDWGGNAGNEEQPWENPWCRWHEKGWGKGWGKGKQKWGGDPMEMVAGAFRAATGGKDEKGSGGGSAGPTKLVDCMRSLQQAGSLTPEATASLALQFLPILAQRAHRKQEKLNRQGQKIREQKELRDLMNCLATYMGEIPEAMQHAAALEAFLSGKDDKHCGDLLSGLLKALCAAEDRSAVARLFQVARQEFREALHCVLPEVLAPPVKGQWWDCTLALHDGVACKDCQREPLAGPRFEYTGGGEGFSLCAQCYIVHCAENREHQSFQCHFTKAGPSSDSFGSGTTGSFGSGAAGPFGSRSACEEQMAAMYGWPDWSQDKYNFAHWKAQMAAAMCDLNALSAEYPPWAGLEATIRGAPGLEKDMGAGAALSELAACQARLASDPLAFGAQVLKELQTHHQNAVGSQAREGSDPGAPLQ